MTKFTILPKIVKVLQIVYSRMCWNGWREMRIIGKKPIIGKYFVAEHSKTSGLNEGDEFIIKEKWLD